MKTYTKRKGNKMLIFLFLLLAIVIALGALSETFTPSATEAQAIPTPFKTYLSIILAADSDGAITSDYLESYTIRDNGFGTEVDVQVDTVANTRTIVTNALPNHETGEFPSVGNPNTISAQDRTWTFPITPVYVGQAERATVPGVGINGIKYQPNTGERAECDNGVVYNLEAIQDTASVGLDFNNAHVQPTGEYHYHGVSQLLVEAYSLDQDLVHIGFAADGYLMYYSKSGAYTPSYRLGTDPREGVNCVYTAGNGGPTTVFDSVKDGSVTTDWDYNASFGDLDECNGISVNGEYIYLITNDYPYVPRCLMGEFTEDRPGGGEQRPPQG